MVETRGRIEIVAIGSIWLRWVAIAQKGDNLIYKAVVDGNRGNILEAIISV